MKKREILLVDDQPNILAVTAFALEYGGYRVTTASSGELAIEALSAKNFDLVITDLNMPETNGIAILKKAKELHSDCGVMILTTIHDASFATEALRLGADDYMLKPWNLTELRRRVDNCLERSKARRKEVSSWHRISKSPFTETATAWT